MTKARELAELARTISDTSDATAITINSSEEVTFADDIFLADSKKVVLGAGPEIEMYSNGTVGYIDTAQLIIANAAHTNNIAKFIESGAVELYHNNGLRLASSASGVDISGTATANNLTLSNAAGVTSISVNAPQYSSSWTLYSGAGGANAIGFWDGSAYRLTVNSTGIDVTGSVTATGSGNTAVLINTGNNSGDNSQIKFGDSADDDVGQINYDHGTNAMQFRTNAAANTLVLDNGGSVGIGGTPTSLLDVKGSTGNSVITLNSATAIDSYPLIGELRFFSNDNSTNSSGEVGSVEVIGIGTWNGAANNAAMTFNLIQGLAGTTSPVEAMRIDNAGKIQIATSSGAINSSTLSVAGSIAFDGTTVNTYVDASGWIDFQSSSDANKLRLHSGGDSGESSAIEISTLISGTQSDAISVEGGGTIVINQDGVDRDFRVEGNSNGNMFVVDASNDTIGIGTQPNNNNLSPAVHFVNGGTQFGYGDAMYITGNTYYNNSWKAIATGAGATMVLDSAGFKFLTNASASANSAVSLSEKVRIQPAGISFNGDSAAANCLDDYEEGAWTPVIVGMTATGSFSPGAANGGFYVKIGRQVTAWMNANGTLSGASGIMNVTGLPFPVATSTTANGKNALYSTGSLQYWHGAGADVMGPLMTPGATQIYFHTYNGTSNGSQPSVSNQAHNLHCFVTYYTD